ncbi:MAG: DUF4157 domain-containing protein [Flavobacteriaceae bacterium]
MRAFAKNNTQNSAPNAAVQQKGATPFFGVQAKLSIGKPQDKYEVEADAMADKVVSKTENKKSVFGGESFFPSKATPIQKSPFEEVQQKEETEEIQEKPLADSITPVVQLASDDEAIQEKCTDCEAEEKVQKLPFEEVQQKEEEDVVQEKCDACEAEEKVQTKKAIAFPALPEGVTDQEKEDPQAAQQGEEATQTEELPSPEAQNGEAQEGKQVNDLPPPKKEEKEEKEFPVQEKSSNEGSTKNAPIEAALKSFKGGGVPLPATTQQEMSQGFGADFSNVKIHTGGNAVQMNKDLGAHAFTNGNDIYFNQGKYNPESKEGKHLLAHELTHTVQQGASGSTIQRYVPPGKKVTPEGGAEKPNDGAEVEGKSNSKITNDERVQDQGDLSEEEIKEKKDPPRGEVHQEKGGVLSEGVTTPPVDRGAVAQEKIADQKAQMEETLSEEPPAGEGGETEGGQAENSNMGAADASEQAAAQSLQAANAVEIPAKPQPFKHPNVIAPVDSAGQPLPRKSEIDTQVRGLGYIAEMLREKGYEMKQHASEKTIHSYGLDGSLHTSRQDLALAKEGTKMTEDHNTERKGISETSKEALTDSQERQAFVSTEAPGLAQEADEGKGESSALSSDAKSKAAQSESEIPDDPDARADAQQQSGEMNETANGAQSMDDAISQTGERARQYIQDAEQASKDNQQSEAEITENDSIIAQIDGRVAEMKVLNEQSQASIDNAAGGPELIRQHATRTAASGDELIAATIAMETELNALQDEYIAGMAAIESKEAAEERIKKEQEEKQQQEASPQELQLYEMAAMPEAEQEAYIQTLPPEEKQGLMAALDKMIAETPDDGTAEAEGKRLEVKLSSGEGGPTDPRQDRIDAVDNQRVTRLGGVLDVADQNMSFLSVEQQKMLAEKLVAESITDDIKNISVQQMAKGMLEGMVNPMASLDGVVGGFEKTLSGVANIFNAEAWSKDPLGNLLQIGADISTGLAMVFSSILGIAGMITALMVALTIISWGTLSPITGPVIGWMGTVMTYAGWGAIVAGVLSVYFNSLAYIKNLNDAGTAATARELFGNTEQMKKNASDGFTGAMAVVEGVGAVKMGPVMKSGKFMEGVPKSPGAFAKQTINGAKEGLEAVAKMPARAAAGAKKLFAGGKKGLTSFKKKIQGFFKRADGPDIDGPRNTKRDRDILDNNRSKTLEEMTPEQRRVDLEETANGTPKRIEPDSPHFDTHDIEIESNGHTYRRRKDGKGWCRFSAKECGIPESDLPDTVRDKIDDLPETTPRAGEPGSPEHKAQRWEDYKDRGGEWSYERWEKQYEVNMKQAPKANAAMDAYHEKVGWGKREVTVKSKYGDRRLDIADIKTKKGIEHKTGYQTANQSNLFEVKRDADLMKAGWKIEWVFEGTASKPLLEALDKAKIPYKFV